MSAGSRFAKRHPIAWLVLVALMTGCATEQPTSETPLTGQQIEDLIVGNTLLSAWEAQQLTMVFYADGTLRGSLGLTGSDSGVWSVHGDTWCQEWIRYFGGVQRCYRWYPTRNGYLLENVDAFRIWNLSGRIQQGKPPGY